MEHVYTKDLPKITDLAISITSRLCRMFESIQTVIMIHCKAKLSIWFKTKQEDVYSSYWKYLMNDQN